MKIFDVNLNSAELLAQSFGGRVEENFIIVPDNILSGTMYFLNCAPGINALYVDAEYNEDVLYSRNIIDHNYIGLHFNLTEGQADLEFQDASYPVGKLYCDLIISDSSIKSEYLIKKGSKSFALYIFIEKNVLNYYFKENKNIKISFNRLLNSGKKTIRLEKMSSDSLIKLKTLQNRKLNESFFELNLNATVNFLISNTIDRLAEGKYILNSINETDLNFILNAQEYLFQNIDKPFPTIGILAREANMSETKFKKLYKKIIGETPNSTYLKYKLLHAKSLLEQESSSISEISDQLFLNNAAYFSVKFKELFGISPKEFVDKLK